MQAQLKNTNTLWGVLLVALGAFFLLQVTGIFGVLTSLFWSVAFAAAGAVFLYVFLTALHTRWWAAIPGFTLLGLAATIFYDRFAPPFFSDIGGAVFLASIGAGFVAIFFTNREQWWADHSRRGIALSRRRCAGQLRQTSAFSILRACSSSGLVLPLACWV